MTAFDVICETLRGNVMLADAVLRELAEHGYTVTDSLKPPPAHDEETEGCIGCLTDDRAHTCGFKPPFIPAKWSRRK